MKHLINMPPNDDEDSVQERLSAKGIIARVAAGLVLSLLVSFSLAGTINIGGGEAFELGQRSYEVGTCATGAVQIIPKTTIGETSTTLSQFTVVGISPVTCNNRIIRIKPFDTTSPAGLAIAVVDTAVAGVPDQAWIDIYVTGNEFRARNGGALSLVTDSSLSRTSGSLSIRRSVFTPAGGTSTVEVYSGGQGQTLKSNEDALDGLAISFQIRFSPNVSISGYGRTDIELFDILPSI